MSDRERQVRDEAYRIWEEKGRPLGDEHAHWHEAEKRVGGQGGAPKTAKAVASLKGAAVDVAPKKAAKPTPPAKKAIVKGEGVAAVKTETKMTKPSGRAAPPKKS